MGYLAQTFNRSTNVAHIRHNFNLYEMLSQAKEFWDNENKKYDATWN